MKNHSKDRVSRRCLVSSRLETHSLVKKQSRHTARHISSDNAARDSVCGEASQLEHGVVHIASARDAVDST